MDEASKDVRVLLLHVAAAGELASIILLQPVVADVVLLFINHGNMVVLYKNPFRLMLK